MQKKKTIARKAARAITVFRWEYNPSLEAAFVKIAEDKKTTTVVEEPSDLHKLLVTLKEGGLI